MNEYESKSNDTEIQLTLKYVRQSTIAYYRTYNYVEQ